MNHTTCLLVMTDGRYDLLDRALSSLDAYVPRDFARRFIHDDSGDPEARAYLLRTYGVATRDVDGYEILGSGPRRGFGGAIQYAWECVHRYAPECQWVFHLEDDFRFIRHIDLFGMRKVLEQNPHIAQMALRRQAWNNVERGAGGVVEVHPDAYFDRTDGTYEWLEQRMFFTTNPSLYRISLLERGWPSGPRSEGAFTFKLLEDDATTFGYWGSRDSGVWVEHDGRRIGTGY